MKSYAIFFVCPECRCVFLEEEMHHVKTFTEFITFNEADTGEVKSADMISTGPSLNFDDAIITGYSCKNCRSSVGDSPKEALKWLKDHGMVIRRDEDGGV